jgi:hypothetical protein
MKQQLSYLYLSVRDFVAPLEESLDSAEGLEFLFQKYGWETELDEEAYGKLKQAIALKEPLEKFIEAVDSVRDNIESGETDFSGLGVIIGQGNILIQSIAKFEVGNLSEFEGHLKDPDFWKDIAEHIFDDLLATYMQRHTPVAHALLHFFGVIRYEINTQTALKTAYTRTVVDWDQLVALATNPMEAFNNFYHWNQNNQKFNHRQLLQNLHGALESLKVFSTVLIPPADFLNNPAFNPSSEYNIEEEVMELYIPFLYGMHLADRAVVELGLSAIPIPEKDSDPPSGFLVRPVTRGAAGQEIKINDDFKLVWRLEADASNLLQLKIFPDKTDVDSGEITAGASFGFHSTFSKPRYIFGNENTTHLKLQQFSAEFKILGKPSDPEIQLAFKINGNPGLSAVLLLNDSDGFLKETVSQQPAEAGFSPEIIWSNKSGITFNGNMSLDTAIALNKEVADLQFKTLYFSLAQRKTAEAAQRASLNIGLELAGNLGPVTFTIDKIGCDLSVRPFTLQQLQDQTFEKPSLVFGNLGLDLNYLPPKGIGLKVKSDVITGGGFLEFDPDNHRYAGVLELKLALEKRDIGLTAVGLINTRLPNGEEGFSMLVSISVFFSLVIPLSFGFTLNAVGGLVGIYRTMKVDILRERIQNGAVKSIMFPGNVIENTPKIISDLRAVFPPQKKHYVVAPFFKIGYGTPTVMEVDLGILLEFPFKGRIILLGSLGVYLPNKEAEKRLGEIHVDIFGDFNFAASYILIEGRLRDSNLVEVALTGGFAFMLDWGNNPQFLLSVGGYHPRYKKPARFPEIPRVTALIKRGEDIRLSCQYYQAITSNSYQIGLTAELVVKKGKARAYGFLGFNALLQFDPFYFETDIRISVEVSYRGRSFFGIEMEFMLSGPEPWRAQGFAKIKVLFFSLKIKFNISWGEKQKVAPVIVKPDALLEKLKVELKQSGNWTAKIPAGYSGAESLRNPDETGQSDLLLMHPSGYLELRQNLVPLNKTIEKLGNSHMEAGTSYRITNYAFGTGQPIQIQNKQQIQDYFSRGQFEDLPDGEKLSTPDFDLMSAGIEIAPEQVYDIPSEMEFTSNNFEDIILEGTENMRSESTGNWQEERALNLSGTRKPVDATRPEELFGMVDDVPVQKEKTYKILSKEALKSPEELKAQYFNSYSGAKDFLRAQWPEDEQRKWQILQAEVEESEEMVMG